MLVEPIAHIFRVLATTYRHNDISYHITYNTFTTITYLLAKYTSDVNIRILFDVKNHLIVCNDVNTNEFDFIFIFNI